MNLNDLMGDVWKGRITIWQMKRLKKSGMAIFRTYIILCLCFVVLYPLIYMLSISLRPVLEIMDPAVIWVPKHFTFENILEVMNFINYPKALKNSVFISVGSTILTILSCSLAGYGFARFNFKGKNLLFGCVLFSIVVPMQSVAIPMFMQIKFFDFFGIGKLIGLITGKPMILSLYNSPAALFLPALFANGIRGGLYIYIFRQFFRGMPLDLEDAAYMDGCGLFKTMVKIIMPLALPPFLVTFILSVIWYWNDVFMVSLFYSKAGTLAVAIDSMAANLSLTHDFYEIFSFQQSGCLLLIMPVMIMFMFLQKYFMESIDKTGLK